jgi:hypothetical protein
MNIYNKCIKIIFISLFFSVLLFSCFNKKNNAVIVDLQKELYLERDSDKYIDTVNIDTNIEVTSNSSPNIILKTRFGVYKPEFEFEEVDYYIDKNIIVINTIDDLRKIIQKKYFHSPFLKRFSPEYFDNYYLVFVFKNFYGHLYFRNERIEQNNGKYIFTLEKWARVEGNVIYIASSYRAIYVLEIPK